MENESYYEKYCIHRKHRASELSRTIAAVETTPLWHGAAEESVVAIANSKFDRGYAGKRVLFILIKFFACLKFDLPQVPSP